MGIDVKYFQRSITRLLGPQASRLLGAAEAPFAGTFRPESYLNNLTGASPRGVWKLRIDDVALEDKARFGLAKPVRFDWCRAH